MNKNYTPKYIPGLIGIRFKSHEDNTKEKIDENGNYIIDYNSYINDNNDMMNFFENKYNIKFVKNILDNHFLSEYFYIFHCTVGKENELMNKIEKDIIVNHCSRIDERVFVTNKNLEYIIVDLNKLESLELDSLSDAEIDHIISTAIDDLKKIKNKYKKTMNKQQLVFLYNNSLKITINDYDNSIFFVYNKSIERQLKYNKILNINKQLKYSFNKNDILFEYNIKDNVLYIDYNKVWHKLNNEYENQNLYTLIGNCFNDNTLKIKKTNDFCLLDDDINWEFSI
jgi:hypothetical protein